MFCKKDCPPGHTRPGVMGTMEPRKREAPRSTLGEDLRLNPQLRLCARFDDVRIAEFPVAAPGEMGLSAARSPRSSSVTSISRARARA